MKIELQEPYKSLWKTGYLTQKKSGRDKGRRNVSLVGYKGERSSVSYARYLMSVKLGRLLTRQEHVDHINGDKSDDRLDNYQILTPAENIRKSQAGRETVTLTCVQCGTVFERLAKNWDHKKHKTRPFCSRKCLYENQRRVA